MIKGKKESKLSVQISEGKSTDGTLKNINLNVRKKRESDSLQQCKNRNVKQKVKQISIKKSHKVSKNSNVSNMLLKYNKEMYEYQIQQLNLQFKQSLKYPTLTQDELKVLFMKYKSDGHYRTNENLPPFTSLLNNTHGVINEKNCFYDQAQCISVSDVEKKCFGNNEDVLTNTNSSSFNHNQYVDENSNIPKNLQSNFKHDMSQFTDTLNVHNPSNKIENRHLYNDEISSNNNYMYTNYNEQMYSNANLSDNTQYFAQSKSTLNGKKLFDVEEEEHFPSNLTNVQNVLPEERQSCRYADRNVLCNIPDSNAQYESSSNSSELPQQNDIHCSLQDNNFSFSSNFYNDFYLNKWNNMSLLNKNSNHQPWKSTQSICIPPIANLGSYYSIKNTAIPHQLTLIKNHSKEQGRLDSPVHTNPYYLTHNKNMTHFSNDNVSHMQENFNAHPTSTNIIPDNFLSETNAFIPSCANMTDQYN
ncbi:hypothetical protein ANTPLA_LOCUS1034 [Anthophora plagiata]